MALGPTFGKEILAAGLGGKPFSWKADGAILGRENLSDPDKATLDGVIAAHDPEKVPIPDITRRQALLWLLTIGKTDADILTLINGISDSTAKETALIEWNNADVYHREHPLFAQLGPALGLSSIQMDAAFVDAARM